MSQLLETVRSSVQTWECDQMGHMNVQFYVAKEVEGIAALSRALGLRPKATELTLSMLAPRDQHIRFHRELRPGAPFVMHGGVLQAKTEGLVLLQEMKHSLTGVTAATFVTYAEWCDIEYRSGLPLPTIAIAKSAPLTIDLPSQAAPRGLNITTPRPAPTLEKSDAMGMITTLRGYVTDDLCDRAGFMRTHHFMGRISDAIPNLLAQTSGRSRDNSKIGGAALEYRFVYRKPVRDGDLLVVKSGLKTVGAKTYNWCHWLFDGDTGECFATAEAVAISLDLVERKAIDIPPEMRTHLESLVVPGISV